MKAFALAACALLTSCASAPSPMADDGWIPLFDGTSLAGWTPRGGGVFTVDQGTILGVTGTGAYGWLCSDKTYGDFVLECEALVEGPGNSGIQVRSHIDDKDLMTGYQFDLDRTRPSTGRLYDEARRKLLQDVPLRPDARQALKPGEWNRLRLECVGDRLRSWVNDVAIADAVDAVDLTGILALQVHSGKETRVRWRGLRLKDLGRRRWEPLWNGRDLEGWKPVGEGEWTVTDGVLTGKTPRRGFAALATAASFRDFTARIVYQRGEGKAGLRFGSTAVDGVAGSQVALTGAAWTELVVSVHDGRTTLHAGGEKISDVRGGSVSEGPLAVELVGEGSIVRIRSIELLGSPRRD